jgi:hypothetical protein
MAWFKVLKGSHEERGQVYNAKGERNYVESSDPLDEMAKGKFLRVAAPPGRAREGEGGRARHRGADAAGGRDAAAAADEAAHAPRGGEGKRPGPQEDVIHAAGGVPH